MKTHAVLILSALLAAWSAQAAERIDARQLPSPVRGALDASARNEAIREVTIHNVDGRTVYDVELERPNAPNPHLRIAADGAILRDTRQPAADATTAAVYPDLPPATYVPHLQLAELPNAVQRAINKEASGREIAEITSDVIDGRPAYRVEFREAGRNARLFVAENGTLLQPPEKPPVLGLGTVFANTPSPVQQTIRHEIGDGEITKIDKEGLSGPATVYRVQMKAKNGASFELYVGENGKIIRDSRREPNR